MLAALLVLAGAAGARAREASLKGAEMAGFGRIGLQFDQPTKVTARVSNGILLISFSEPVTLRGERLAAELPSYVSLVRRDPDGTGLRLALTKVFRLNLLEAGERVFIDLLPQDWTGLPPGLPQEVVAELARRAREAESQVRDESRRRLSEPPKTVTVRVAQLPTLTRAVFIPPSIAPVSFRTSGNEVSLHFDAPLTIEAGKLKPQLGPAVRAISAQTANGALTVKLTLEQGYEARGFREDETFVVDVVKPKDKPAPGEVATAGSEGGPAERAPPADAAAGVQAVTPTAQEQSSGASLSTPSAPAVSAPRPPAGPVKATVSVATNGLRVVFPFAALTAAAAFERGNLATLVFHTAETIELPPLPAEALRYATRAEATREGPLAVIRFSLATPQLIHLAPEDKQWVLTVGDQGLVASDPLNISRSVDETGRSTLAIALADAPGVHWLREPHSGERLAVATAFGPPRVISKPQTFVEFRLLQTAHGVVVVSEADDLVVEAKPNGVSVARPSGLSISPPNLSYGPEPGGREVRLVIARDEWRNEQRGDVFDRYRALMREAAETPAPAIGEARVNLARFLVAVGMDAEAAGLLDYAVQQDTALLRQKPVLLLRGIAAVRMRRLAEARKALSAELLLEDPEAILWRAVVDAHDNRWRQALNGFQRSNLVLDLYPEDLQGYIRSLAVRAGIEAQDLGYAENELIALDQLPAGAYSAQETTLLRTRVDEVAGRFDAAVASYRKMAMDGERPVAAEAMARWIALALRSGSMPRDEAVGRLETLSFIWRGDEIEIMTISQLGRAYAELGRWRDSFTMAMRANRLFPDHDISRALHEETGQLFDDLFLSGKGESLSQVEALALYFDFKQFTPIGRRGDEIVRRLADRLVELDLLEQAGDLLQYQVEHRLTGAARSTVAARLATIHLMDNKPAAALAMLHATRLPELPAPVKRARMLLEARALSDLGRTELAIEVLQGETGAEIDRLRADIYWTGQRWGDAGEAHEGLAGTRWQGPEPLSDRARLDVLRAAVGYSLANDRLGLDRLRTKFAAKMADSADARTFAFLMRPNIVNTRAFRDIARTVTGADTLADFLTEYRKRYPDASTSERQRASSRATPPPEQPGRPQAQRAPASPSAPNG